MNDVGDVTLNLPPSARHWSYLLGGTEDDFQLGHKKKLKNRFT